MLTKAEFARCCVMWLGSAVQLGTLAFGADDPLKLPDRKPAERGFLPDGPVFKPDRPKPVGNETVLNLESLLTPPSAEFTIQRRNNFYKRDNSDGLYRWAASGHWSNYDAAKTGDWKKTVPDPLKMFNGEMCKDADTWWKVRRPEVVKLVETFIYGKVPDTAPRLCGRRASCRWETPAVCKRCRAPRQADSSTPTAVLSQGQQPAADMRGPGGGGGTLTVSLHDSRQPVWPRAVGQHATGNAQLFAAGIGTVTFSWQCAPNVTSNPPAGDDWGAIRKFAWVRSKCLDYLESDRLVNPQVAVTGHSIGGKQALITGVFDQRIGLGVRQLLGRRRGLDDEARLGRDDRRPRAALARQLLQELPILGGPLGRNAVRCAHARGPDALRARC